MDFFNPQSLGFRIPASESLKGSTHLPNLWFFLLLGYFSTLVLLLVSAILFPYTPLSSSFSLAALALFAFLRLHRTTGRTMARVMTATAITARMIKTSVPYSVGKKKFQDSVIRTHNATVLQTLSTHSTEWKNAFYILQSHRRGVTTSVWTEYILTWICWTEVKLYFTWFILSFNLV